MFDLDGTLLNTIGGITCAMNSLAKGYGLPEKSEGEYAALVGQGARKLVEDIFPSSYNREDILTAYKGALKACSIGGTSFYPGIPEMLTCLKNLNLPMAVYTNKPQDTAEEVCSHFFTEWKLSPVKGQVEGLAQKPDAGQALEIIGEWGIKPEECLYLGDTATDIQTARNGGFLAVGCTWGFRDREELEKAGADIIVDSPEEVTALLIES